jgi:DNA polymerase I
MTSGEGSTQAGLGQFDPGAEDRPDAEARAVAGDGDGSHAIIDPADERYPDAEERIDIAVTQVDYTLTGSGREERPILHVFGRTGEDGREREHVRVHEFRPYFYAPTDSIDETNLADVEAITGWEETNDDGEPYESIRGEKLTKIFGRTPRDVGEIRDRFDHFEADILFPNRFLIDKDVNSGIRVPERRSDDGAIDVPHEEVDPVEATADLRVLTFDIEVDDRRGFPEDGEEPIVCLSSHDSYREEYVAWLYNAPGGEVPPPEDVADHDLLDDDASVEVRAFESEEGMLSAFMDYVEETDVDLMTGWNFQDFDAPYLIDRLEELDLDPDRLSRVGEVWSGGYGGPNIKGRVVFDLLYAYQRTKFTELDSYRLDDVAEMELGVGKERYPGDIGDLWETDPERLLEYNVRDVELCVELDRKQEIIAFWDEARKIVGCKIEDATTPGDAVDMYVLHEAHGEFALPSKGTQETEEFEGGAVFDPITGVKEMVSVLDLKCFSGDTELLTPEGAKNIRNVEPGDPVYTLNPDTFECEVTPVAETYEYDNQYGELHHLSGNTHDFKITENHRVLASKERGWDDQTPADFEFSEYRDLTETERYAFPQHEPIRGDTPDTFDLIKEANGGNVVVYYDDDLRAFRNRMPDAVTDSLDLIHGSSEAMGIQKKVGKYLIPTEVYREHSDVIDSHADGRFLKYGAGHRETPFSFEMADWLEFLGWFVTEGSIDRSANRITIHQQGETHREAISELLDRMGINHSVSAPGVYVSNQFLFDWLEENCGAGYANKHLPAWVFDLDAELLKILLDTMIRGDGSRADSGLGKFWTKSDQLKDDIVDLAVRCGEKPTVSKQDDGTWYVSIGKRGSFQKKTNATVEDHDGTVYCVTAEENNVVLAGRNGHFQWIGQSLYPMSMVTINASPETQVDPESYEGETYHTPTGIHFRKEPDGIIREMVNELLDEREEKKALRNDHDPGSSEYERYDRQQAAVKVIMNCFTPDTDVVTPDGVRNIRDLEVGDPVYSLDPDAMEMEVKPVTETHEYPDYRGELVDIETSKIDFRVTPNHRMVVRKNDKNGITEDEWSLVEAGDLYQSCNYEMPHGWEHNHADSLEQTIDLAELAAEHTDLEVTMSDGGAKVAAQYGVPNFTRSVPTNEFLQFLAWFITEGNVYRAETANYRVKIAQEDEETRDEIESLVDELVDYHYTTDRSVSFSSRVWADVLETLCGGSSETKRIPELVFQASEEQKRAFLRTLIRGDGDRQENSWRYSTISDELRDDVLRLCTHLGLTASHNHDGDTWRIYVTEDGKNSFRMHRSGSRSTAENGVYCVTVEDNHTLLAGRNGKYQFSHNSLYGVFGWDRFRLYDREMSAGVTSTNREVIEFTEKAANELDKEVIYGDTDSVMLELGHEMSKHDAIEQSFEIEEYINDRYDEFAREELNAATHRFQIEFEKLYRRFFQAGKKKRYAGHIVWKEGKDVDDIDITGFEYQRSDIAPITKEVQREVLEMIVTGESTETVTEYVHDVIERFRAGEVDLEEIGVPGGIGKRLNNYETDTAQVRGAKYANLLLGTNFGRGSKPKRLYIEKVHPDFWKRIEAERGLDPHDDPLYAEFKRDPDVICFQYADQVPAEFQVDYDEMLEKTLKGPIARVIEALGMSWDEVASGQEQTGLGNFM